MNHPSLKKVEIKNELPVLVGLSFIFIWSIFIWPNPPLQNVLGFLYVLFFPGYSLVAVLFPCKDSLSGIERIGLIFGLSIAIVTFLGLLLNYTPWGIQLIPTLILLISFIIVCLSVAYYRRNQLPPGDQHTLGFEIDLTYWQDLGLIDKSINIILVLSIVAVISAFGYGIAKPKTNEIFTEFYILGPKGAAGSYPQSILPNEPVMLTIGVSNHEYEEVQYRVEVDKGSNVEHLASLQLGHSEKWEQTFIFSLNEPGENQKVEFLLFREKDEEPYRTLYLWITVKGES